MPPCPTCGGFHRPEQPHQPPTVPKAPPEQPSPDPEPAQADTGTGSSESADQSGTQGGRRKDDEEEDGDAPETPATGQRVSVKAGVRSARATGTVSVKSGSRSQAEGQRVSVKPREATPDGERPQVSIRSQGSSGDFIPPPPPDGSPAGIWDHYMQALPPTHRNREAARGQINESVQDLDRAARIDALADYAHGDEEREFLEFTGYLPTLDEERDEQILAQERQRRARIAAARRARAEHKKRVEKFNKDVANTRAWLDGLPDDQESNVLRTRFEEAMGARGGPSSELLGDFGLAVDEYVETRTRSTPVSAAAATVPATAAAVPETSASAVPASGTSSETKSPPFVVTGAVTVDEMSATEQKQPALVAQGLASSPYASDADYQRNVEANGFSRELEELTGPDTRLSGSLAESSEIRDLLGRMRASGLYTAETMTRLETDLQTADRARAESGAFQGELARWSEPRSLSDGPLASDPEWQGLLARMRQSGLYSSEALNTLENNAAASDRQLIGDAVATLPPEMRSEAISRIEGGENPFAVLQEQWGAVSGANTRILERYNAEFRDYTGEEPSGDPIRDWETWNGETRRREKLAEGVGAAESIGIPDYGRLDTPQSYDRLAEEYAAAFREFTGQEPTFDPEQDQAIIDDTTLRRAGPDTISPRGPSANSELADSDLPGYGAGLVQPGLDDRRTFDAPAATTPRRSGPLDGATAQPLPVGQTVPLPPDIDGWKSHGTVFINNEPLQVQDLIDDVRGQQAPHLSGRELREMSAEDRAEATVNQYLARGYLTGQVRMDRYEPPPRTLTHEDLRGGFNIGGVQYEYSDWFRPDEVRSGPRKVQLQRHRDAANQRRLEQAQAEYDAGRLQLGEQTTVPYYALPDEGYSASELIGDIFAPVGTVQEIRGSLSPHSPGGRHQTGPEKHGIAIEGSLIAVDAIPLPVGTMLKTTAKGTNVLVDAGGHVITRFQGGGAYGDLASTVTKGAPGPQKVLPGTEHATDMFGNPVLVKSGSQQEIHVPGEVPQPEQTFKYYQKDLFGGQHVVEDRPYIAHDFEEQLTQGSRLDQRFGPDYSIGGSFGSLRTDPDYLANLQAQYDYLGTQPVNRNMPGAPAGSPEGTPAGAGSTRATVSPDLHVAQQTEMALPKLTADTAQPTYLDDFAVQPRPAQTQLVRTSPLTETGVAPAPVVRTGTGLYVPAALVSPDLYPDLFVAQQQRTADAVETGTLVDRETGLVADVAVDPETGTVVGVDRETGTSVVVDGRTGTATVIEPGTRAFPGERVFRPADTGPSIRPFTGEALSVRPDMGVRTRLIEDTGIRHDVRVRTAQATGLQQGLGTGAATGVETGTTTGLETGTGLGISEFPVAEFRVPGDFPEPGPVSRSDIPDGERIKPDDPAVRPRQDDPESKRRGRIRPKPDVPAHQSARRDETTTTGGHPVEAEFYSLERNTINFVTGEITEEPVGDTHLKTLQVTKRGPRPTEGASGDTGAVTVVSRRGKAEVEDENRPRVTPREGVMKAPRPSSSFPRGGGRRRRDEDMEEYNGRNSSVTVTLR